MKKFVFYSFIIASLICSCTHHKSLNPDEFVVKGKLSFTRGEIIYLKELTPENILPEDSVKIGEEGNFEFRCKPDGAGFYLLKISDTNFVTLLLDKGEVAEVSGDVRQLAGTYEVKGSKGSELLREYERFTRDNYRKVDSLGKVYFDSKLRDDFYRIKMAVDSAYAGIFRKQQNFVKVFILNNCSSLASLFVIYKSFGQQRVLNEKEHLEYFEKLDKGLMAKYPGNKHVVFFHKRISDIERKKTEEKLAESLISIGSLAPDMVLNDKDGKPLSLSSLRGKIVLMNFWGSSYKPCRAENKKLIKLYAEYKDKGFEIFSIAIEHSKQNWLDAIEDDGMTWKQVSDLQFENSSVLKLYHVKPEEIPYNILLDKEGKVIAKGLTAETLVPEIQKIFDTKSK